MSHAQKDLERIASVSDYVVHTVSEVDLVYHKSVLRNIFSLSRKLGLEVWVDPWGVGGVFGGETLSRFLLEHRESWQMMSDGRLSPTACLNRSEWRSFVKEWVLSVRDMGAQVIFWDEPHVSFDVASEADGIYSCICAVCQQLYKKKYGGAQPGRLTEEARRFRLDTIKDFLNEMMSFTKWKGLKNALCLYAFKGNAAYDQVWQEASQLPDLDIFGCDPYWRWRMNHKPQEWVKEFSLKVVDSATKARKGSQVWIQAMRLPSGTEHEILKAVEAACKAGVTHIAAWSFDGGELLDPVLSQRPEQVWKAVEEAYRLVRA